MSKLSIISDDLTGSMETGVQFAQKGLNVNVVIDKMFINEIGSTSDVLIIDTESRNIPKEDACKKVSEAYEEVKKCGLRLLYKKIDSTLRGNVGIELQAVYDKSDIDLIVLMPALPFNGRTTVHGVHYLNGTRVTETDLGKDPFSPVRYSYIPDIVNQQSPLKAGVITLSDVRGGKEALCGKLNEIYKSGYQVAVIDAESDVDIQIAADALEDCSLNILPCGSSGLFSKIYGKNNGECGKALIDMCSEDKKSPVLVISGSPAKMSKTQISTAKSMGEMVIEIFDNYTIDELWSEKIKEVKNLAFKYLSEGKNVIIDGSGKGKEEMQKAYDGNQEALFEESSRIQDALSMLFNEIVNSVELGGAMIIGGDTVLNLCRRMGVKGLQIRGEVEPYIPLGNMLSQQLANTPVVTKAGGFGNEHSIINVIKYLKRVRFL